MLDQFVSTYKGKSVDVDKYYGAQCWDLVELYAELLGVPKEPWAITLGPQLSAKEAWTVFDSHLQKYFTKIPKGQEQKGDILVYDGHGIYTEGHIAICLGGGQVFEQNADPDLSPAHVYPRNNTYLLGTLRIKGGTMLTKEQIIVIYDLAFDVDDYQVNSDVVRAFTGKSLDELLTFIHSDPSWIAHKANISSAPGATELKPGLYQVK